MMRRIRKNLILYLVAFVSITALPAHTMGSDPEELRLSYDAETYRAWPVVYGFRFNGLLNLAPETTRCCIGETGAPGATGGAGISYLYEGDVPDIELDVVWVEVHSDLTYRARLTFSTDEIIGWSGGNVIVTFSFRPGGELVLYADGPELAATRIGPDVDIQSSADMGAVLTAPGLGRAHLRSDYVVLRRVCGTIDPDPPEGFQSGRASFAPSVLEKIDADRALPLPPSTCERNE